jgi:hypothetical protein
MRRASWTVLLWGFFAACSGTLESPPGGGSGGAGGGSGGVGGGSGGSGGGSGGSGGGSGGSGGGGGTVDTSVHIPTTACRPVDIMPLADLQQVAARIAHVGDADLKALLESCDTMWYDHRSIIPGYQDSFGDNVELPIGFRPNSIDAQMIDLAVPGGHAELFQDKGTFNFPFGRPAGVAASDLYAVDFFRLPRGSDNRILPVVYWFREPNGYTHRYEWMFPKDTIVGELLFIVAADGQWYPFEIRTRKRLINDWTVNVYRPFPTAESLASALDTKRQSNPSWASAADITALINNLRDASTVQSASISATHFQRSFPSLNGATDVVPGVADDTVIQQLLMETPFVSARGSYWKRSGSLTAWAATTTSFSIVPKNYNATFLDMSDQACGTCHHDASRPFNDYYPEVEAYGELWGGDEIFTWHPFEKSYFVDDNGDVQNFNYDNRHFRTDFTAANIIKQYDMQTDSSAIYQQIMREWTNFAY